MFIIDKTIKIKKNDIKLYKYIVTIPRYTFL